MLVFFVAVALPLFLDCLKRTEVPLGVFQVPDFVVQGCDLKLQTLTAGAQPEAYARGEGSTKFVSGTVIYGGSANAGQSPASNGGTSSPPSSPPIQSSPSPASPGSIDSVCVHDESMPHPSFFGHQHADSLRVFEVMLIP
jgi:hypothetical protein